MTTRPRIAVVDYGAGNLVTIDQAFARVGADVRVARDGEGMRRRRCCRGTRRRCRGTGDGPPRCPRLSGRLRAWLDADRPFLGICLGLQLLFDGSDEDGATALGAVPGRTIRLPPPRRSRTLAGTRSPGPPSPAVRRDRAGCRLLLRPLLRRGTGPGATDVVLARPTHGAAVRVGDRPRRPARGPVPSRTERRRRPPPAGQLRRSRRGGPPFAGAVRTRVTPDAPAPGHPVPRRGRRPGGQGHALRRPRRRGRPGRARRTLRDRGRRRACLPRHHGPRPRVERRSSTWSSERPAALHPADGRRRRPHRRPTCATCCGPARTRSRSTRPRSSNRRWSSRCAARFGRQAVVVAIDAASNGAHMGSLRQWQARARPGWKPTLDLGAPRHRPRRRRAPGHLDRSGRDRRRLRHRAPARDLVGGRSSGHRLPGGAAGPADFVRAIREGGADAVLAASIFHRRTHRSARSRQPWRRRVCRFGWLPLPTVVAA